ncbi:hypothetical protein [Nocardioides alcanivorans]|uniref:hypothetical protein n=1 Tax=Nocardioides alcanivorans TaxID=2897352 RepID=UPI001F215897|nr:hypothetical protein [Nocardioides alcanivorans]
MPLAAIFGAVYVLVPRWRWSTRWPMVGTAVIATASVVYSWFSGRNYRDELVEAGASQLHFQDHAEHADVLLWVCIVFLAVALLAAWALGGPSPLASGRGARPKHAPLVEWSTTVMLLILVVCMITMTVATGEAGARLVHG